MVSQLLDYASWIANLTAQQITSVADAFLPNGLAAAFQERFSIELPESLNADHSMVIIASQLDAASERIVQYLSKEYGVNINVIFFNYFKKGTDEFLGRSWLMGDPRTVEEKAESRKKLPWSGYWYVNVDGNWEDCKEHAFISAGGGKRVQRCPPETEGGGQNLCLPRGTGIRGVRRGVH